MKDEAFKKLMKKAAEDLNLLKVGCENMGISDAIFGFHAQQTVEKIFKAWLCLNGKEYPFTHDLRLLYNLLANSESYRSAFPGK
ncbi:MAG: HEPN domain-containing protein [Lentisphaerota bacterium]